MSMHTEHQYIHVASWPSFSLYRDMVYSLGPDGKPLCDPIPDEEEGILYADLDPDMVTLAKGLQILSGITLAVMYSNL